MSTCKVHCASKPVYQGVINCYVDELEGKSFSFGTLDWNVSEAQRKNKGLQSRKGRNVPQELCNYLCVSDYMTKYFKNGKAFIIQQVHFFSYIAALYFQLQQNGKCFQLTPDGAS